MHDLDSTLDYTALKEDIRRAGKQLGFAEIGVARAETGGAADRLRDWLQKGCHGEMDYMARHAELRANPELMQPGTLSVISAAVDYLPHHKTTDAPDMAAISRYAQGRDYHKVVRSRLQKLADIIEKLIGPFGYRVYSDSAPVMEVHFAEQAGLGWRGKHTLLLSKQGSWRFLGEIYTDLPLPADEAISEHCGTCTSCISACPTKAITAPYQVDARRCISYLTIELHGAIPEEFRSRIGNRIYGCDDCQTACPWNRFAQLGDPDFRARQELDASTLLELFLWNEAEFMQRLAGSPIRRIGHQRWLRNLAVALGNAPYSAGSVNALKNRLIDATPMLYEHIQWAIEQLESRRGQE